MESGTERQTDRRTDSTSLYSYCQTSGVSDVALFLHAGEAVLFLCPSPQTVDPKDQY